jgi:alkylated DNA repair dioxygenase AlkB
MSRATTLTHICLLPLPATTPLPLELPPSAPEGFAYRPDFLSEAAEGALASRLKSLPFEPFRFHGYTGNRRVVSFGWRYAFAERVLHAMPPIPEFLVPLRDLAASFAGLAPAALEAALVTEYAAGAGIGWHRDKAEFGTVVAFSLLSECRLRFRRNRGGVWQRMAVPIAARSAYLLRGPARHEWQHSIPAVATLRYSVTFRDLRSSGAP